MATTTNLNSLVINYLTQAQYDEAAANNTLNENQLYLTPTRITAADISRWNSKSDTDEKVALDSITTDTVYYPLLHTISEAAEVPKADVTGFSFKGNNVSPWNGYAELTLGSSSQQGRFVLYNAGQYYITLNTTTLTANRTITFPDKTGTIALTSDISKTQLIRWTEV